MAHLMRRSFTLAQAANAQVPLAFGICSPLFGVRRCRARIPTSDKVSS